MLVYNESHRRLGLQPTLTGARVAILAVAAFCAIVAGWFVLFFRPDLWLWKTMTLPLAMKHSSGPTSSAALSRPYHWQNLTQDQAAEVLRRFAHDPNLPLRLDPPACEHVYITPTFNDREGRAAYGFTAGNYDYAVSRTCDSCFALEARSGTYDHSPHRESQLLSEESVRVIAERFVREHYPDPRFLEYRGGGTCSSGPTHCTYTSRPIFFERVPGGAMAPGSCSVDVDRVDGRIIGYQQRYFPILAPTRPTITQSEAIRRAEDLVTIRVLDPPQAALILGSPDKQGREHLYWRVLLTATGVRDLFQHWYYRVDVDARDGSIYDWHV